MPGLAVWLSRSEAATRKYPHTWEMVETDVGGVPTLVGINPQHPNRLVGAKAIAAVLSSSSAATRRCGAR